MTDALSLAFSLDVTSLVPGRKNECHAVAEISANRVERRDDRPPMAMVFVLDSSSSMRGAPLAGVVQSLQRIIDLSTDRDSIGIVTFGTTAKVELALGYAMEWTKDRAKTVAAKLEAGAQTNMEAGLRLAIEMLAEYTGAGRSAIFLLSDGVPNVGRCTPMTLAEVVRPMRRSLSVWALGYGPHHQEDILDAIASASGGRYAYIPEPEICELMFVKALGVQGAIVAEAVELWLRPQPAVEVTRVLGKREVRREGEALVIALPDILEGTRHLAVAELSIEPAPAQGLWKAATAQLRYRVPGGDGRFLERESFAPVMIASTSSQIVPSARVGVLLARCDVVRDEARSLADRGRYDEAVARLSSMRGELVDWPGFADGDGSPLAMAADVLRDEMMALEAQPAVEQYKAFRRSQLGVSVTGESSSWQSLESAYGDGVARVVAGEYPAARLEQIVGSEQGRIIVLTREQVLGRGKEASVMIDSERVSRTHAVIAAQRARFFVIDLGSANGTWVNGVRVQTKALMDGDVVTLASDAAFRYQEVRERRMMAIGPDGEPHVIEQGRLFVIGRSRACSLALADDEEVARRHAAISVEGDRYRLDVYAGAPPVVRDGEVLSRLEVADGDRIRFGATIVRFELR
jgi:pSer/pThr/pTyr-binding forkhead associated (FHA) protein/Mg-chelatase subunit ChlD